MVTSVSIDTCKTRYSRSMRRLFHYGHALAAKTGLWIRGSVKDERLERRDLLVIQMEAGGSPMIQFLRRGGKVVSQLSIEKSAKDVAPFRWAHFSLERF